MGTSTKVRDAGGSHENIDNPVEEKRKSIRYLTCTVCPASPLVEFVNDRDTDLSFCGHHANRYQENLLAEGWTLKVDTRTKI